MSHKATDVFEQSDVLIMKFTSAASGKGVVRGQNGGRETIRGPQARDDSNAALEMGNLGQNHR